MKQTRQRGFTLVELVAVIIVLGILAAIALPRFAEKSAFDAQGYADAVVSALRWAQKAAIAQRRTVCVDVAANQVTLTLASSASNTSCNTPLALPGEGTNVLNAPAGVSASTTSFQFSPRGAPNAAQSITISGTSTPIVVEAETGYVH